MDTDNKVSPVYITTDEWGGGYVLNELSSIMQKDWEDGLIDIFKIEVVDGKITIKTLYLEVKEDKAAWRDVEWLPTATK